MHVRSLGSVSYQVHGPEQPISAPRTCDYIGDARYPTARHHTAQERQCPPAPTRRRWNETEICQNYITPAIAQAGWDRHTQIRREYSFTAGRVTVRGKVAVRGKRKRADYLLFYQSSLPLAVVEGKGQQPPRGWRDAASDRVRRDRGDSGHRRAFSIATWANVALLAHFQDYVLACPLDLHGTDGLQLLEDALDHILVAVKERVRSAGVQIAEGRLIERCRFHDASGGELGDHHLDEADLWRREAPIVQELREH